MVIFAIKHKMEVLHFRADTKSAMYTDSYKCLQLDVISNWLKHG